MISFPNHCVHKLAASIVTLSVVLLVLPASFTVAQSSTLFSWQGAISPPVVTNQVWGDHHLFEKGTGYKEFAIEINQGNGAEITATASGTLSLYVVPDEYAGHGTG